MPADAAGAAGAGGASSRASSAGATAAAAAAPVTLCGVARETISLVIVGPRDVAQHDYVHRNALTDLLGALIAGRFDQKSLRAAVNLGGGALHGDSWGKKGDKIKKPSGNGPTHGRKVQETHVYFSTASGMLLKISFLCAVSLLSHVLIPLIHR